MRTSIVGLLSIASFTLIACVAESQPDPESTEPPSSEPSVQSDESAATACYADNVCHSNSTCCSNSTKVACKAGGSKCCRKRGFSTPTASYCCSGSAAYWGSTLTCN